MTFESGFKIFQKHMSRRKQIFFFMGKQGPWSGPYVKNNKLMITFFQEPGFSGFLMWVITGSGVSFGQIANSLELIPHHMTALPVFMSLDFQACYNFELLISYPFDHNLWVPLYRSW